MKMIKRMLSMLLVLCMAFALCACGGNSESKEDEQNDNKVNSETNDDTKDDADEEVEEQPSFEVKVVDQDGNPVQGVMVQVCKEFCLPAISDADGIATISIEIEDGHKLQFSSAPEGYTYEGETDIYLEAGQTEYTMELKKAE